jgi:sialic acid synthase SpsE
MQSTKETTMDSNKLEDLIKQFISTQNVLERAKKNLIDAQNEVDSCNHSLATFIVPEDAKKGEVFSIWVSNPITRIERLLCMEVPDDNSNIFKLYWRK